MIQALGRPPFSPPARSWATWGLPILSTSTPRTWGGLVLIQEKLGIRGAVGEGKEGRGGGGGGGHKNVGAP
jgi:hypothetical protein